MKIIVSAGGTGGHLYPALALVDYIKTQDSDAEFLFVGTTDRLESQVVPDLGYNYRGLKVKGLVGNPLQKAKNALIFVKSLGASNKILKEFKPDIVIGFGGYPSASIVLAASGKHIPTMIHEQNSIIGLTNKILIKRVDKIVCCYEKAMNDFPGNKTVLLGNPRASVVSSKELHDIHDLYDIEPNRKTVVIVMGSLGSSSVNEIMKAALRKMQYEDYDVIYVTGKNYYDAMKEELSDLNNSIHLVPYIDDMPSLISSCDLIVSRAGATTLAEITALGAAALIIPSPYVVANHQEYNAKELVDKKAACWILEKDLNAEGFVSEVNQLIKDDTKLKTLKDNAKKLGKPNACQDIYQEILKTLERK
ncbi:MAG: undecaprenyldiphospho-muramoylpentapeptide beta-N-acetylglucosaminyltransferase [Erysipelotrichaceae bacterium]|nr:undecaprenyldiphospho-muramoylpentapeptide beta-N-acetylglucosaminyltransferase [Erysipelotrichaceae bacterium]